MTHNGFVTSLGKAALGKLESYRSMVTLLYDTIIALSLGRRHTIPLKQLINQILFVGVDALLISLTIGLIIGVAITHVSFENMDDIGISSQYGLLMIFSIVCELGPFITAVVVVGRSGAALTTFLGNMKVTREIDALESMGIDVVEYLVVPAFLGMMVSLVALNFYFAFIALMGGVFFAKIAHNVSFLIYIRQVMDALVWSDIPFSILKSTLFGAVVAVVSSYHGLVVKSLRIVPRAVYRSVITSISGILVINIILSVLYYVVRSRISGY